MSVDVSATPRRVLGVDPGLSGALALVEGNRVLDLTDMPIHELKTNGKLRRQLDLHTLAAWIRGHAFTVDFAVIENVHAMPKQGVSSVFSFGRSFGVVEALIAGAGIAARYVEPAVWKRAMGLSGEKDLSRQTASRLLPSAAHHWARKRDDGRAESALLAYYGGKTFL